MRKHSKEFLQNLTPFKGYELLVEGNERFINNLKKDHAHLEMINETRDGQFPFAMILSCMDSRGVYTIQNGKVDFFKNLTRNTNPKAEAVTI
jgi:hypothetical protein